MAILDALATTAAGALFATAGVIVGGVVTRKAQDRQWLRDKQLAAYDELLSQYARLTMELSRAHYDRRPKDYDWAEWKSSPGRTRGPRRLNSAGQHDPAVDRKGSGRTFGVDGRVIGAARKLAKR